jgi:hypothetical protein
VEPGDVIWFAATTWREQMPPGDYMIELERLCDTGLVEVYLEGAPLVDGDERHGSEPAAAELEWAPEVRPIDELSDESLYPASL